MLSNTLTGTFTTGASATTAVVDCGSTPYQINLVKHDGSLMASYIAGVTVASIKGTFAATFTVGVDANGLYGVTFGGLANSTQYDYVIIK